MSGNTSRRYPPELRQRAVRLVAEIRGDHESEWASMTQVADLLGVGTPETVRKWCRRAEVDTGRRAGLSTEEAAERRCCVARSGREGDWCHEQVLGLCVCWFPLSLGG